MFTMEYPNLALNSWREHETFPNPNNPSAQIIRGRKLTILKTWGRNLGSRLFITSILQNTKSYLVLEVVADAAGRVLLRSEIGG
jgi:hypothetical protein